MTSRNPVAAGTVLAVVFASLLLAQPALAEKNTNAYAKSIDAAKLKIGVCKSLKKDLDKLEKLADKHSGTKAAAEISQAADSTWDVAAEYGCSWAQ